MSDFLWGFMFGVLACCFGMLLGFSIYGLGLKHGEESKK